LRGRRRHPEERWRPAARIEASTVKFHFFYPMWFVPDLICYTGLEASSMHVYSCWIMFLLDFSLNICESQILLFGTCSQIRKSFARLMYGIFFNLYVDVFRRNI
jgi:hypothetical protein